MPVVLALLGCATSGCTLIADLDRFEIADGGADAGAGAADAAADAAGSDAGVDGGDASEPTLGCENPRTLCVRLQSFDEYKDHLVVIDLVNEAGQLRARALLDPAADQTVQDVVLPLAAPEDEGPVDNGDHPLHVEVWADKDDDRQYDADTDESFLAVLQPKSQCIVDAKGERTKLFAPTPIGGDYEMTLRGFHIHSGRLLEVMVIESVSRRTVGMYRLQEIPAVAATDSFTIVIPDVIKTGGSGYEIEFYADVNGNGTYDGVGPDHPWVIPNLSSSGSGLALDRTHSAPSGSTDPSFKFAELSYQFDFGE